MPSDWTLLKEELGSGGYGKVVRARRNTDGKEAAAKIVSKRRMKLSAIQKEVQLMEMLSHPNIIAMYAAEEVSDNYYIYMELATGGELFGKVIDSGALSEDEARPHFVELMSAVQYMHSMGVVHRDLKLENVLLDARGVCKVCDFGLAHVYQRQGEQVVVTRLREVCGSKSYCAPEVLAGAGYEGFPTDVWSCGICLFAMLAGFFPLDEAAGSDWRFERVKMATSQRCSVVHTIFGFYDRPCVLTRAVVVLIDAMLTIDPARRLTLDGILSCPWALGQPADPLDTGRPVYRSLGSGGLDAAALAAMYDEEDAADATPVYRGGPALGPPPGLAKQVNIFCEDFYETVAEM